MSTCCPQLSVDRSSAAGGDRMRSSDTGDLWWKNAVFYCADVETFYDWNGDGTGDIRGMTERIEYLYDLGVTCLWLMPFYPTARKDDGYDITDFFGVDPRLGTHGDFVELVRTARSSGIRVIIDFVMNHTSDAHPWFKSARRSKDDPYRDYYVWSATEPKSSPKDVVFPDQENSIWERDPKTNEWYLHHFYKHQPDLNIANPKVQEEISRTLGFWLELGVSGFRVDAVPFLFAKDAVPGTPGAFDPNQYLGDVRNFVTRRVGDAVLLGEVNLPYKDQKTFFGGPDGDGLNMQFDFIGMQNIYLSLARGDARPIAKALRQRPTLDVTSQWANFVRNHDELTLDKLSDDRAPGGLRRLRPRPGHAALRPRTPPKAAVDARRRRAADADGLLADVLPAGHARPVLRRGDRDGREPRHPRTARRAHADAVDRRRQRRLLQGSEAAAHPSASRRPLRPGARQRRRPAPRPPLLLVVHAQPHLHVPTAAGDRLVDGRDPQAAQPGGAGPCVPGGVRLGDGRAAQLRCGQLHRADPARGRAAGLHPRRPARRALGARARRRMAGSSSASRPTATDGCACGDRTTSRSSEPAGGRGRHDRHAESRGDERHESRGLLDLVANAGNESRVGAGRRQHGAHHRTAAARMGDEVLVAQVGDGQALSVGQSVACGQSRKEPVLTHCLGGDPPFEHGRAK